LKDSVTEALLPGCFEEAVSLVRQQRSRVFARRAAASSAEYLRTLRP